MRLPNIVTAISDVLAGVSIGASLQLRSITGSVRDLSLSKLLWEENSISPLYPLVMLVIATVGLYGGGVVLNDVFDATLDKTERPERPIPSGLIGKTSAAVFGVILLLIGIGAAALSNRDNFFNPSFSWPSQARTDKEIFNL